jgi:hypothetical protein
LIPFGGEAHEVNLSEHQAVEMVWNGTRYVVKGTEEEDEPEANPPPPPPVMDLDRPPPTTDTPGFVPQQSGGRTRAAGRYVSTF